MHQVTIQVNDSIYLTEIRASDQEDCVGLINSRVIYDRTLLIPHPYGEQEFKSFFECCDAEAKKHGHPLNFAIRDQTDQMIGGFGFERVRYGHCAEIGYWLGERYWGRGIMTDVVAAMTAFACQRWKLVRITAHVFESNAASARVLEKAGFRYEGANEKYYRKDDQFIDAKAYALVSENVA